MRPVIKKEEFAQRLERMQELMQKEGIDLIVTYSDDRFVFGQEYSRWLFDFRPAFEPACAVVPAKGEGYLLTGAESDEFALEFSHCDNVYVLEEFFHPDEEYVMCEPRKFSDIIREIEDGMDKKVETIGVASVDEYPYGVYTMLADHFDMEKSVDIVPLFTELRKIKTPDEIAVLRYAFKIAEKGMLAALDSLKVGITEREVAAVAEHTIRMAGAETTGIELMVSFGKEHTYPVLSHVTDRELKKGDLVVMTLAPRYQGYHGCIARSLIFGGEDEEIDRVLEAAADAHRKTTATLVPGKPGSKADTVSREVMTEAGYGMHFPYTGIHSVGVVEFEPPIMNSEIDETFEENMVIAVDIPVFETDFGGLRIEHGFLVTKDGPESLMDVELLPKRG